MFVTLEHLWDTSCASGEAKPTRDHQESTPIQAQLLGILLCQHLTSSGPGPSWMEKMLYLDAQTELSEQPVIRYIRNEFRDSLLMFLEHSGPTCGLWSSELVSADLFPPWTLV